MGYRDHKDHKDKDVTEFQNLTDVKRIKEYIGKIKVSGGGDIPEAVMDGLDVSVNTVDWRLIKIFISHC